MSQTEKCLFLIPLEWGIRIMATIVIYATINQIGMAIIEEGNFKFFWPWIIFFCIMSCFFIFAFIHQSAMSRLMVFIGWVVLVVVIVHIYEIYIALSGKWYDYLCVDVVKKTNNAGASFSSRPILSFSSRPILTFSSLHSAL